MDLLDEILFNLPDSFWKESLQSRIEWKRKVLSYTNHSAKRKMVLREINDLTKMLDEVKEELLPNGTLVMVRNDESKTIRKILWSMPEEVTGHRYCIEGWGFICEKRDLIVQKEEK